MATQLDHRYPAALLDEAYEQIRILVVEPSENPSSSSLRCSLQVHDLSQVPEYEALSYCWGTEEAQHSIELNGSQYNVKPNLYQALKHQRLSDRPRPIWIDALCINQNDLSERNSQVKLMRQIYKTASSVMVWLGVEADNSSLGAELIRKWSLVNQKKLRQDLVWIKCDGVMFDLRAWEALEMIMTRAWWSRVWGYQEYVLAKDVWFHCGNEQWSAASLAAAFNVWNYLHDHGAVYDLQPEHYVCLGKGSANRFSLINSHHVYINQGRKLTAWESFTNIVDVQQVTHSYDSSDPRDKLYALLGFDEGSRLIPPPDYRASVADVYHDFATRCLLSTSSGLKILHSAGIGYANTEPSLICPSWVPDFRSSSSHGVSLLHHGFCAAGSNNVSAKHGLSDQTRVLTCEGVMVDTINHVFPFILQDTKLSGMDWIDSIKSLSQTHPTKTPLLQVLFRTLILDDTRFNNHTTTTTTTTEFSNEETQNSFFKFLVGFILAYGVAALEELHRAGREEEFIMGAQRLVQDASLSTYLSFFWHDVNNSSTQVSGTLSVEQNFRRALLRDTEAAQWLSWLDETMDGSNQIQQDKVLAFVLRFTRRMARTTKARALVVTRRGYLGLAPSGTKVDDQLCCIFGCETPFVLRQMVRSDRFQLVGQSYVYGLMHGEAVQNMVASGSSRQHFEIV